MRNPALQIGKPLRTPPPPALKVNFSGETRGLYAVTSAKD